jgi:hypothetical protein
MSASLLGAQGNPREAQPERPTVATHAGTVAPRYLEIETGVERDGNPAALVSLAPTVFKFGVAGRVQLDLFTPIVQRDGRTRFGDVATAAKIRLLDDAPLLGDFAIQPSYTFNETRDASLLLISSRSMAGVAIDLNAGITRRTSAPRTTTVWTASFGGPFDQRFGWVAELYGYPGTAAQSPIVALLAGPTFELAPMLVLDAGFISPLAGPQPHALYAGLTYNVGRYR